MLSITMCECDRLTSLLRSQCSTLYNKSVCLSCLFWFYGPQLFSFDSLSLLWSAVFRGSPSALPAQSETVEHLAAMEADVSLRSGWSLTKAELEGALDQIAVNIAHKCCFIISVCAPKWPIKVTYCWFGLRIFIKLSFFLSSLSSGGFSAQSASVFWTSHITGMLLFFLFRSLTQNCSFCQCAAQKTVRSSQSALW